MLNSVGVHIEERKKREKLTKTRTERSRRGE
jgi:hypothetical protein